VVYRLKDNGLKVSHGYEIIDPDRPWQPGAFDIQEPSVKFLHPDEVDWRAKRSFNPMTVGCAVDPGTVPRMVRWCDKQMDRVIDVDMTHNTMLVSERVRDVMERFEPGVHQFLPVDIYLSPFEAGDVPVARSYWLVVGQYFDAVSAEHTHQPRVVITHPDGRTEPGLWDFSGTLTKQPKSDAPVIFDRGAIAGRHLWIDRNFTKGEHPFMSDALGSVLREMDLYGARFQHFDEI
jgi:Immunity protein family (Imm11)